MGRVALRHEVGPLGLRVRLDYAGTAVRDQWLKYDFSYIGGAAAALYPLNVGRILVEGGLEAGYGYATQRLTETGHRSFAAGLTNAGLAMLVTAPMGPLRAGLDVSAGAQMFKLNDKMTARPSASAALLVLYGF